MIVQCSLQLSPGGQKWPKFISQPESSKNRRKRRQRTSIAV